MLFRARRAWHRRWFDWRTRALLRTAPLQTNNHSFQLVSMVCHGEVQMYLLAAKSFCLAIGSVPEITVLDDGTLTAEDTSLLRQHVPGLRIVPIAQISTGSCPRGNCWERLMLICDLNQNSYVVQMDADTLTNGPVPEVAEAIGDNRSFTLLGDRSYPQIETLHAAHPRLRANTSQQVQAVCERNFDRLPESGELLYLRGNAGFVGYGKGSLTRDRIEHLSERMRTLADGHWDEWGSEQLMSNLLIANTPGAFGLPFPRYLSFWNHLVVPYQDAAFLHFIGPYRFAKGLYIRLARRVLARLP